MGGRAARPSGAVSERVRFSPAPTGALHIGGARTALFNWLIARGSDGSFVLRVEDTDADRTVPGAETALVDELRWLGLEWDEGPDVGGPFEPYRQSERSDTYDAAFGSLRQSGLAYRCFCPPERLAAERAEDEAAGRSPRYRGTCRALGEEEATARAYGGEPHAWRFAVTPGLPLTWTDGVHGPVDFQSDDIGDFIIVRSDGTPTWLFASWADDVAMGITLVIRGDDHLSNTPRQLLLSHAAGLQPLRYAHLPLVTEPGGRPLAKSAGDASVAELRDAGYPATAVVQHLALLGWTPPERSSPASLPELAVAFSLERVSRSPAVHEPDRLRSLSARHLRALSHDELVAVVAPYLAALPAGIDASGLVETLRDDLVVASDAALLAAPLTARPTLGQGALTSEESAALGVVGDALAAEQSVDGNGLMDVARGALKHAAIPARVGLHALRLALTGATEGLPLATLLGLLDTAETLARIEAARSIDAPSPSGT